VTTAPATDQDSTLYGPDGRPLTRSATQPAAAAPRPSMESGDWRAVTSTGNATVWEKPRTTAPASADPGTAERGAFRQAGIDHYQARIDTLEAHAQVMASQPPLLGPAKEQRPATATAEAAVTTPATPQTPAATKPEKTHSAVDRFGPWVALYAAVGLTASGEYELAHLVGFPGLIAALLPTAIDIYVVQAMRRHRDVLVALLLMVATNALFHLADAGLFGVTRTGAAQWWLIVLVAGIAPFIVWRVHRITETKTAPVVSSPARETSTTSHGETETSRRETGAETWSPRTETTGTGETKVSVSPHETDPRETSETGRRETTAETSGTKPRETRSPQRETSETTKPENIRETKRRPARETKPTTVTGIGDRETETTVLLDLMRSRGGAEKVSLDDAMTETGRPKSTAAKRLAAARDLYKTA
jgi:hypothetical protein